MHSKVWLVFVNLDFLFSYFHETSPERQDLLLKLLHEDTLNKWKSTISALPSLYDTHHFPFLMMLLNAHNTFSKVYDPEFPCLLHFNLNVWASSLLIRTNTPNYTRNLPCY
jgi:hypothetical protein